MMQVRVSLVHLGRQHARGEVKRVESWRAIFEAAGASVDEVALLPDLRAGLTDPVRSIPAVVRGDLVPEAAVWSWPALRAQLRRLEPDVVVCVTARAFHPGLVDGAWYTVLDYVDRLSVSYAARARYSARLGGPMAYRVLAGAARRFETRGNRLHRALRVAAGWSDAQRLGVEWVPNVVPVPSTANPTAAPLADMLFFGTLTYAPNVHAVERLGRMWPLIRATRPETTLLIAGASPSPAVMKLAERHRWEVHGNFSSVGALCASARMAVAPLTFASGIQNKVLEAAAHGLAQVVTPAAVAGMKPGFPVSVAENDEDFVAAVCALLDDPATLATQGLAARRHVVEEYSARRWAPWATHVLEQSLASA